MKRSERLVALLQSSGYPHVVAVHRLTTGRWQRAQGAWSWYGCETTGSEDSMAECVRRGIVAGDRIVYAAEGQAS